VERQALQPFGLLGRERRVDGAAGGEKAGRQRLALPHPGLDTGEERVELAELLLHLRLGPPPQTLGVLAQGGDGLVGEGGAGLYLSGGAVDRGLQELRQPEGRVEGAA